MSILDYETTTTHTSRLASVASNVDTPLAGDTILGHAWHQKFCPPCVCLFLITSKGEKGQSFVPCALVPSPLRAAMRPLPLPRFCKILQAKVGTSGGDVFLFSPPTPQPFLGTFPFSLPQPTSSFKPQQQRKQIAEKSKTPRCSTLLSALGAGPRPEPPTLLAAAGTTRPRDVCVCPSLNVSTGKAILR